MGAGDMYPNGAECEVGEVAHSDDPQLIWRLVDDEQVTCPARREQFAFCQRYSSSIDRSIAYCQSYSSSIDRSSLRCHCKNQATGSGWIKIGERLTIFGMTAPTVSMKKGTWKYD